MTRVPRRQLLCDLPSTTAAGSRRTLRPATPALAIDPPAAVRGLDRGATTRMRDGRVVRKWEIVAAHTMHFRDASQFAERGCAGLVDVCD